MAKHHVESLGLEGFCADSPGSALVGVSNCWKTHATAQVLST